MKRIVGILLVLSAARADAQTAGVTVDVRERATAGGGTIRVGDLADVRGEGALARTIGELDLAESPAAGETVVIPRRQIEFRLRLASVPDGLVRFTGADSVSVTVAARRVTAEEVVEAARARLLERLPWSGEDVAVELARPVSVALPTVAAGERLLIRAEPHAANVGVGPVQMDVTLTAGDRPVLAFPVRFEVRLMRTVAVCLRPVGKDEPFTESNVAMQRRAIGAGGWVQADPDAVIGATARRGLNAGEVVRTADVATKVPERGQTVAAGEVVRLLVRVGPLTVEDRGVVVVSGRVGDTVQVRNEKSNKLITGRLSGPNTVEINPGGSP